MALLAVLAMGEAHAASSEPYRKEEAFSKGIAFDQRLGEQVTCGFAVRLIRWEIPDAALAAELRKLLANTLVRNVPL